MNLSEHPQAIDLQKRIAASGEEKCIPVQIYMPVMGMMMGAVRISEVPGLFILTAKVDIEGTGKTGMMEFTFTADKPIAIIHPDLTKAKPESRIMQ